MTSHRKVQRRDLKFQLTHEVGPQAGLGEDWIEFMKRSTAFVEEMARKQGQQDWVTTQRERKWRFARKTAADDGCKWTKRLLSWKPWFRTAPYRRAGRPKARWGDALEKYCGGDWAEKAQDHPLWVVLMNGFALQM